MSQLLLFTLEGYSGTVIREEAPFVKLLSNPSYDGRKWVAVAQVESSLATIEVSVKEYSWRLR